MKKIYGSENQDDTKLPEHPTTCGCEACFWKEKRNIGKLTEKNVADFIESFISQRKPIKTTNEKHNPLCMCVTCIREKVNTSKEETIKDLLTKKQSVNKDPRINREQNNPQ